MNLTKPLDVAFDEQMMRRSFAQLGLLTLGVPHPIVELIMNHPTASRILCGDMSDPVVFGVAADAMEEPGDADSADFLRAAMRSVVSLPPKPNWKRPDESVFKRDDWEDVP